MANVTQFKWKDIPFTVKFNSEGITVYRDTDHLGGPWSEVSKTLANRAYDSSFRKALAKAERELYL